MDDGTISTCEMSNKFNCIGEPSWPTNDIPDINRSASTCTISLESPISKLAGAQEEVFSKPTISEKLKVGGWFTSCSTY